MSVGHIARAFEESGISTVVIAVEAFREKLVSMSLPRVLITPFPMGRPIGFPGNRKQHLTVIKEALNLLTEATEAKTVLSINELYLCKE